MIKYSKSHEWALIEGDRAKIGLTEYGVKELGEIVYVELPEIHKVVRPGDEVAVFESTKAAADFSTPLAGKVLSVNPKLKEGIELLNTSPEAEGWLFEIELIHPEDQKKLLTKEDYLSLFNS